MALTIPARFLLLAAMFWSQHLLQLEYWIMQ